MPLPPPIYMAMAGVVALFGAWTATDLFRRVHANVGRARIAWLTAAALALGLGLWAAPVLWLLGLDFGGAGRLDGAVLAFALAVAAGGSGLGLSIMARRGRDLLFGVLGGAAAGLGAAIADFVAMAAVQDAVVIGYDIGAMAVALLIAMAASAGAMALGETGRSMRRRLASAVVLALGVVAAEAAASSAFVLQPRTPPAGGGDPFLVGATVAGAAVFVLFLACVAALFDRRFEGMAAIEAERNAARLRSILEQTPVGIVVADAPSGEIQFVNPEAEYLMGHDLSAPGPHRDTLPYGPIDDQGKRRSSDNLPLMRAVRRGYRTDRMVMRYRKPDGSVVMFEVAAAPIRDADGRIVQGVATFHDVTAKMKAEEALRQSQRMEGIGQLTGGVAHDFNNVLTAVLGSLQLASKRVGEDRARQLIDNAIQAAERGAKLTSQLLAFSRRQRLEPLPVDLNAMIERMGGLFSSTLGGTVKVEKALAPGLPPALADPAQLELALLNLALNARDAMPSGGVLRLSTALVTVASPRTAAEPEPGRYIALSVKDTGPGMSEEVMERAFEPFFTTKPLGKGSGLGLSQVLGLAKQLGGGVRLDAEAGRGVEVTVYLPISPAPDAAKSVSTTAEPPRARKGARVLVVDDDPDVRRFIVDLLEDSGYGVVAAVDGPDGLKALKDQGPFDLLLLDFAMPGMTGSEVARTVHAQDADQPVLMMTGYLEHEAVLSELGAQPMLQKPFDPSELLFRVAAMVARDPA
jgi:signal transduction histidine kinase/NO-binding membrane sensor protein with MHYT domain